MKKPRLVTATVALVLALTTAWPDIASAQRRFGGFGGFRGASVGFGGFRGGFGGFRGGAVGVGFRPGVVRSAAFGSAWRPGWGWNSGIGWGRPGWRAAAWGGPGWGGGWGWRRGWGWPVAAAALTVGAFGAFASPWNSDFNQCWAWNGFSWVNVCYQPYPYW